MLGRLVTGSVFQLRTQRTDWSIRHHKHHPGDPRKNSPKFGILKLLKLELPRVLVIQSFALATKQKKMNLVSGMSH